MCEFVERYPILERIPAGERATWAAQAEAGQPLTDAQCRQLGLAACDSLVLMPVRGRASEAQVTSVFGGDMAVLKSIIGKRAMAG